MRLRVFILTCLLAIGPVFAEPVASTATQNPALPITHPQNIAFERCSKMFALKKEKLFYSIDSCNILYFNCIRIYTASP